MKRTQEGSALPPELVSLARGDLNVAAAALLQDMAEAQENSRSQFGYKRAAKAIVGLPVPVSELVRAGALRDIPFVGPSSARIVTELVELGRSPTVEAAVAASRKGAAGADRAALREGFLSHQALERALEAPLGPGVVGVADYRGDFQTHSTWSDGGETIAAMAKGCLALGHTCLGVTDHSHGLPIARGISMADAATQGEEIDALNARYAGRFRIFKGIEANVLADGTLDISVDERRAFEFVVAAPHSLLRRDNDQTGRMVGAVRAEGVAVLGHPRGRMFNSRAGVKADWDAVFAEAAARRVAIEIDGNWHRQDIDFLLAARALRAGCLFALDSDAHSVGELRYSRYALAHARLARIPAERVINCWPDEALDAWMGERRRGTPATRGRGRRAAR